MIWRCAKHVHSLYKYMRIRRKHQTMADGQYYYILIQYIILRMFKFETLLVNGAIIILNYIIIC